MTTKTIKTFQVSGSIELPDNMTESEFYSVWFTFLKSNKLEFKGKSNLVKKQVFVDTSDEPELPF